MKKLILKVVTTVLLLQILGCQPLYDMRQDEVLYAVGYANISEQAGATVQEQQSNAMRASKFDAYRELTEQVYGLRVTSNTNLNGQKLNSETSNNSVDGVIRGAEVLRSYVVDDSYVTEMRLDIRKMDKMRTYGEIINVPENRQSLLF